MPHGGEPRGLQLGRASQQLPAAAGAQADERKGPVTAECCPGVGALQCVPVSPKGHSVMFSICHKEKQARVVKNVPKMSQRKCWVQPGLIPHPALGAAWQTAAL